MTYDSLLYFWQEEGLDTYIPLKAFQKDHVIDAMDTVDPTNIEPVAPELEDLCFLYRQIRQRRALTVLEFGVGYSTVVMAAAMKKIKRNMAKFLHSQISVVSILFQCSALMPMSIGLKLHRLAFPRNFRKLSILNIAKYSSEHFKIDFAITIAPCRILSQILSI